MVRVSGHERTPPICAVGLRGKWVGFNLTVTQPKDRKLCAVDLLGLGVCFGCCLHHAKQPPILISYFSHTLLNNLQALVDGLA